MTLGRGGCLLEERVDARGRGGVGARKPAQLMHDDDCKGRK